MLRDTEERRQSPWRTSMVIVKRDTASTAGGIQQKGIQITIASPAIRRQQESRRRCRRQLLLPPPRGRSGALPPSNRTAICVTAAHAPRPARRRYAPPLPRAYTSLLRRNV